MRAFAILGALAVSTIACSKKPELDRRASAGATADPPNATPNGTSAAPPVDAGPPKPESPQNVLLVSIDSLRADMPWAGYSRPIAPRLEALYAKSIAYTRAYATSSFTSKSIAGLLTGRYPSELARTGAFFTRYLDGKDFFCTSLAKSRIPCIGGHAHAYFGKDQAGFERGFEDWQLVKGITFDYQTDPYVTSDKLTPLAIEMLEAAAKKDGRRSFFAWFHFMDPHDEYKSHAESPHFGSRPRDLYDEEVFFTDLWVGKLLDWVESQSWAARTMVVVTADHGEAFGEHGMTRHAHELWEELVHVPLFFYQPGRAHRTIDTPRSHVDLAPTFVQIVGGNVDAPPKAGGAPLRGIADELPGVSLVAELDGAAPAERDVIVDLPEDDYNERRRALIHQSTKLIAFGNDVRFSLFDLATDPAEKTDLWGSRPELAHEMRDLYKGASTRIHDVAPAGGIPKHEGPRP